MQTFFYIRAALATRRGDRGATAVEYALIIAGVAAVLAVVVFAFQGVLTDMFKQTCEAVTTGNPTGNCSKPAGGGTPTP